MKRMVGVDLGATAVRVAEVAGIDTQGFAIVTRAGFSPVKDGSIVGGKIIDPQQVALALQRALKAAGVSRRGFILGFSSSDTGVSRVSLPTSIKPSERENAIRMSGHVVSSNISLSDAIITTQPIGTEISDGFPVVTLAVGAASKADIDTLKAVCKLAGCEPRALDFSGAALLRALTRSTPDAQEVATVVDIGSSKVTIATRSGLHMVSLRTFTGGGLEISRSLMEVTNESFEDVERRKFQMRVPASYQNASGLVSYLEEEPSLTAEERLIKASEKALSAAAESLIESIAQPIEGDSSLIGELPQGITLVGGTSRLRGVKDKLQQRIGIPVVVGKPWLRLERSQRNALFFQGGQEDPVAVMDLTVAVGLALWKEPV